MIDIDAQQRWIDSQNAPAFQVPREQYQALLDAARAGNAARAQLAGLRSEQAISQMLRGRA